MRIQVETTPTLGALLGADRLEIDVGDGSATLADLLLLLVQEHPVLRGDLLRGDGRPDGRYGLFVNGIPVPATEAATTVLREGDEVFLHSPAAGG